MFTHFQGESADWDPGTHVVANQDPPARPPSSLRPGRCLAAPSRFVGRARCRVHRAGATPEYRRRDRYFASAIERIVAVVQVMSTLSPTLTLASAALSSTRVL